MGSGFFVSSRQRKRTRFCSFYRAGRIKGGLPCGGRKGVARSEPNLLSPSTELERRGATSGSRFEGHEVIGFVPAAGGFRSLRRGRPGDFFAPLSLALVGKESGRAFAPFGPVPKGDACGQHKNAPAACACRGIMSSKTALSDHRACERSESSGIPDPTRWSRSL